MNDQPTRLATYLYGLTLGLMLGIIIGILAERAFS
jgi:hypothetical protein